MKFQSLITVLLVGILSVFVSVDNAEAQPSPNDSYTFTLDTLTNGGTVNFTYPYVVHPLLNGIYAISYQVEATNISGTTDITCFNAQSNDDTPGTTDWVMTTDSVDLDGTSDGLITIPNFYGAQTRCSCTGSGTQSTQLKIIARLTHK